MTDATRTVVVTGAAGALGRALACRFAAEPGTAVVVADIHGDALQGVVAELRGMGAPVAGVATDVADREAVDRLAHEAVARFGRLDVMINNVGVLSPNARLHNLTPADWERTLRVNLMGTVHGMTAAVRVMRAQGEGAIVNTASVAGMVAFPYAAPYGASKAAIINLTKVAAAEYAGDRIRVNCVCPGAFPSGIHQDIPDVALQAMADRHPLGMGAADDLVGAFVYLASAEARWTTGTALVVDGGYIVT